MSFRVLKPSRHELLAPAGSLDSVRAAVRAGADAVYMGGQRFSARAFSESALSGQDMLLEAIDYCHLYDVKLYMAANTLFKDRELKALLSYMESYYRMGIDGVIVQDLGAAMLLRQAFPDLPLHGSTQMTVCTASGAALLRRLGIKRLVLARELSLREIQEIHSCLGGAMELEAFVHGAMCYSYSGACFFSSFLGGRSGNRGRCAGTCRLPYQLGGREAYFLSMKDMSTLDLLPALLHAGAYSLKLEGRMKSPLYTAGVVSIYRKYLDRCEAMLYGAGGCEGNSNTIKSADAFGERGNAFGGGSRRERRGGRCNVNHACPDGIPSGYRVDPEDRALLRALYDRGGFTDYLQRQNGAEMLAFRERAFRAGEDTRLQPIREKYLDTERTIPLRAHICLRAGERARLTLSAMEEDASPAAAQDAPSSMTSDATKEVASESGFAGHAPSGLVQERFWMRRCASKPAPLSVTACSEEAVSRAESRASSKEEVLRQLKKTGGTCFTMQEAEVEMEEGLFLPLSMLNRLRRSALEKYRMVQLGKYRRG